jgi:hypothetical protein
MTKKRLLALAVMFAAIPSVAQAQGAGFWGWLEKLSGPGPFYGVAYDQRLGCFIEPSPAEGESNDARAAPEKNRQWIWVYGKGAPREKGIKGDGFLPCARDTNAVHTYFEVRFATARTSSHPLFPGSNEPAVVANATAGEFRAMLRVWNGFLSAGGGPGILGFTASTPKSVVRPTLTGTLVVMPLRRPCPCGSLDHAWRKVLAVRVEETVFGPLSGQSFGTQNTYHKTVEHYIGLSITANLMAFLTDIP